MRFRVVVSLVLTLLTIAGCNGVPPQQIILVVTATHTPEVTAEATAETTATIVAATLAPTTEVPPSATTAPTAAPEVTAEATLEANSVPPESTPQVVDPAAVTPPPVTTTSQPTVTPEPGTPSRTPLPPNFPTPVMADIQVAEQLFEGGRMFWLQPTSEIWVLVVDAEGRGTWSVYQDTYTDADPANDPSLTPPEGRLQPERGFGKLWREASTVREQLGWAVTPEFGYVSRYEYHAGGSVDAAGTYTPGPGYHVVYSLYGEQFRFNEVDGTWQLGGG
jgi:hypothetical protein